MQQEIERKFFVDAENNEFQNVIAHLMRITESRYYAYRANDIELRFTSKSADDGSETYTFDRMQVKDDDRTIRSKERILITKQEFEALLALVHKDDPDIEPIVRHSYTVQESNPKIEVKVYDGRFAGLIRAEIEFDSVEEMLSYQPASWMGVEISNTKVGNDVLLPDLSDQEFQEQLGQF